MNLKRILLSLLGFALVFPSQAQVNTQLVTAYQYYFDRDPGTGVAGNGAVVNVSPTASLTQNLSVSIPDTLLEGLHTLYVRVRDEFGKWSPNQKNQFYVLPNAITQKVVAYQYYFDTDPGTGEAGNGAVVTVSPGTPVVQNINVPIPDTLREGQHTLFVRVKDEAGRWSVKQSSLFYVLPLRTQKITAYQYYFDRDPGAGVAGNGAVETITAVSQISELQAIPIPDSLLTGFHRLYTRTKDENGRWGNAQMSEFGVGPCANISAQGLISWWTFDNGAAIGNDIAGDHPGTFDNPHAVTPYARFTGFGGHFTVPSHSDFAFGPSDFTIECRATFNNPGGTLSDPHDKMIGQSESPNGRAWSFSLGQGKLFLYFRDGISNNYFAQGTFAPNQASWYHIALTRKGDTLTTFVNGQVVGTQIVPGLVLPYILSPLTMGQMNGNLDAVTIYRRALSPAELLQIANAGPGGKCRTLQITTNVLPDVLFGARFSTSLKASLGEKPYKWLVTGGSLPEGVTLDTTGNLNGIPLEAGEYSFTVQVKDDVNGVAQKPFVLKVLLTLPEPKFTIFKSGTTAVPGREMDYFVRIENLGNVADTIRPVEILEPWFSYISASVGSSIISNMPNVFTSTPTDSIPSNIQWEFILEAGESKVLNYKVRLQTGIHQGDTVRGCICYEESYTKDMNLCRMGALYCLLGSFGTFGTYCHNFFYDCAKNAKIFNCNCTKNEVKVPIDPNEKLVLAPKYIQPDELLVYPVHFENIGTIEAQDVFIRDTLSPLLDISTLKILSPNGCTIDTANRVIKWDLMGINLLPDSSDYVLYSIRPVPGLPPGTVIRNKASIQFEVFDLFHTNETINIIDGLDPEGVMNSLPDTIYQTSFPVAWHGTDTIGAVAEYAIFVSEDGGGYKPFRTNIKDTTTVFTGSHGHTYRFICLAEDVAGNMEVQQMPLVAEARTFVKVLCTNKYFRDADLDGYGDRTSPTFSCTLPVGYVIDSTDCRDDKSGIHPGGTEICNFLDDDCDGQIDEGLNCFTGTKPDYVLNGSTLMVFFPNPSDGTTTAIFNASGKVKNEIVIRDVLGRVLIRKEFEGVRGENKIPFDLSVLTNGIYMVSLYNDGLQAATIKFVKQ